jgi:signal transduction histidine kinase
VSIVVVGTAGAFFLSKIIASTALKPIRSITKTAKRIGAGDLSQRIDIDGPDDEIKELAITFNEMISRLEASFLQQERFVADVSHELRTPISVIQGYVNLLNRWGKHDMAVMQESIDSLITETERMSTLVKKLLFMAKAENNMIQVSKLPIQLKQIVEEVVKEMGITNTINPVRLYSDGNDVIYGSYDLIKQLLWIFTENAIKYSKSPTDYVSIKVYSKDAHVFISIGDKGIGIGEEDLPHIFERFYRANKSRTNQTSAPGTGLGLSIASWILNQHEATVKVKSELGKGTEVIVCFNAIDEKGSLIEIDTKSENLEAQVSY